MALSLSLQDSGLPVLEELQVLPDSKQLQGHERTPSKPESKLHFQGSCLKGQMLAGTLQQQLVKEFLGLDKHVSTIV